MDSISIHHIYTKHVNYKRYVYETRNDVIVFATELLCDSIMNNLNIKSCFDFIVTMFNFSDSEIKTILSRNVLYLPNYTLLDVCMQNWCKNIYDSFCFGYKIILKFNNVNRFDDIKFLINIGAKTSFQLLNNTHRIFFVNPPDHDKIVKFLSAKLIYPDTPDLLKLLRTYRKEIKHEKKCAAKYNKIQRISAYSTKRSNSEILNKKHEKHLRRSNWTCSICLDNSPTSKLVLKNCKHKFHSKCIINFLLSNLEHKKCPYCRQNIEI